ncbi:MAG: helix-turn-helix transcriptional regulator [Verrucomicrobia bacterium]|nr:helix-turn-helix transcriptional regulator [Verrucomicrobiota bacterium]
MKKSSTTAKDTQKRRSACPVACCLDIIGDRWTLLVVRDLLLGRSRFKEFSASPEGIPTNILSNRLLRLRKFGIIEMVAAADGSRHPAYQLTGKGRSLRPLVAAMKTWGLAWEKGTRAAMKAR